MDFPFVVPQGVAPVESQLRGHTQVCHYKGSLQLFGSVADRPPMIESRPKRVRVAEMHYSSAYTLAICSGQRWKPTVTAIISIPNNRGSTFAYIRGKARYAVAILSRPTA